MNALNAEQMGAVLNGKTILVTGAGSGLGAKICERLARDGATLIAADFAYERAQQTAARIAEAGGRCTALALDVRDAVAVRRMIDDVAREHGRLDVVVNNAAVDVTAPIAELTIDDWTRIVETNLSGPFAVAKAAIPHLRDAGGGHIVNIASTAAKRAWPNASAYHATKWGLLGLSHSLHAELRPLGIKVSAIVAGGMRTPFLLERFPDLDASNLQDPANVAEAVRFVLLQPAETVVPELMVLPMRETSWP
jgi:NAD(P)-dependent dehydrogenase (short-subunit alcohol dehydrogenase family)